MRPRDVVGKTRRWLASELIHELTVLDKKIKVANQELTELVATTGSRLQNLHGIGPSGAARLLGDIGDINRFASRAHFASWNGTAPIDASSGDRNRHRLSRAGNRRINRALHIMAIVPVPGGHAGATLQSSADDPIPMIDTSDKSLPGPAEPQPKTPLMITT